MAGGAEKKGTSGIKRGLNGVACVVWGLGAAAGTPIEVARAGGAEDDEFDEGWGLSNVAKG